MIEPPLAVCAEDWLKAPQAVPPQVAVQFTAGLPVFGATVAVSLTCEPTINVAGSTEEIVTIVGAVVSTVAIAVADFVGSAVDVAVIVTMPPGGTAAGLTKVAGLPLAV